VDVYVLYRDMRTYGFYEKYYHEAREKGVIFVRYEPPDKPEVSSNNSTIRVCFFDDAAGERRCVDADLLVLSSGIMPNEENLKLAEIAGLELNADGFFEEANPKAAPLDSKDRGKYFCGICHSPNYIEDVICQGKAAAARASALLWRGFEEYPENQAYVNERLCSGCGLCVSDCPYDARIIDEVNNKAKVLNDLCKGCGTCVITCPNGASQQYDFERSTMLDVLDEVLG
jgi:heterodisulfide reductase subunit A